MDGPMDIRVLRYFLAAVRTGSISGAAEVLHVTQPTLSRQFIELEEELGHRLFVRTGRRLELTPKGERFAERARMIVDLFERTRAEIRADNEMTGEVRIAAAETSAFAVLARAACRLREEAPAVRLSVTSGNEEDVRRRLRAGVTDFGLLVGGADLSGLMTLRLPVCDRWGIVTPADGPFGRRTSVRADDLKGVPLICSSQATARSDLAGWMGGTAAFSTAAEYNLLNNALVLAGEGLGHVLALDGIAGRHEGLVFVPLEPAVTAETVFVWDQNRTLGAPSARFLELVRKESELLNSRQ